LRKLSALGTHSRRPDHNPKRSAVARVCAENVSSAANELQQWNQCRPRHFVRLACRGRQDEDCARCRAGA
jgi:hypothetical protein